MIHGKRAIGVRAIEVLLYFASFVFFKCRPIFQKELCAHENKQEVTQNCLLVKMAENKSTQKLNNLKFKEKSYFLTNRNPLEANTNE